MDYIDIENTDKITGQRLAETDPFQFRCYPGISCFNKCCRHLNLILYPYDCIRLKQHLDISSDEFLDQYVDVVLRPNSYFPDVFLRMTEDSQKSCIFLKESGCAVYPDRPDTCRSFPVERGILSQGKKHDNEMICFFRPPDFCMGQHETDTWTPRSWLANQQAETHHRMSARWAEVKRLFQSDPWGVEGPEGQKAKMAFMVAYNIDRFQDFVFKSSFLKRYHVKSKLLKKIRKDDVELLKFGFEWIKFFLWGIKTSSLKQK